MAASTDTQRRTATLPALGIRTLVFAIVAVLMMLIDQHRSDLDFVRRGLGFVVYPVEAFVSLPTRFIDWGARNTISRSELERENNSLKVERLRTRAELQRFNALEAENARLRAMLNATGRVRDSYSMAEITAVDPNPFRHSITINKGQGVGVYEGQAMVDANGVVGQLITIGPFSSMGLLISDAGHALPVENVRNGLRTIAFGTGEFGRLSLPYLPNNADIVEGDALVTSGLGGAFPAGYPVATVSRITLRPGQPFAQIDAVPAARLNQVREVVLVSTAPAPGETEPQPAAPAPEENASGGS